MTQTLLIRNVRPWGAAPTDMLIQEGRITRIASGITAEAAPVEDGGGAIAPPREPGYQLSSRARRSAVEPRICGRIDSRRDCPHSLSKQTVPPP